MSDTTNVDDYVTHILEEVDRRGEAEHPRPKSIDPDDHVMHQKMVAVFERIERTRRIDTGQLELKVFDC
jgi:hypothetical protein